MLRSFQERDHREHQDASTQDRVPAVIDQALPFRSGSSAPELPSSIGLLLIGAYVALTAAQIAFIR